MSHPPKLTICVPSRNRQRYFQETIRALVCQMRTDIEFVFADNSADPSIMNAFMPDILGDPRVRYIPAQDRVLPMLDNWERCMEAATGDWVCFIGDDDYVDAAVTDLIRLIESRNCAVDSISWSRMNYNWPDNRKRTESVFIPLGVRVNDLSRQQLIRSLFLWENPNVVPNCPFSVYHGAVTRRAMDHLKVKYGRYFEHLTVDFENTAKLLMTAREFVFVERPFSVLGACPESNSASIGDMTRSRKAHADAMAELGRNMDEDPHMKDFPFPSVLGVSAAVAQCLNWFCVTYGYTFEGWEARFAAACVDNCLMCHNQESFDLSCEGYRAAFSIWRNGRYLEDFNISKQTVSYDGQAQPLAFLGIEKGALYVDSEIGTVETPGEFYRLCNMSLASVDELDIDITRFSTHQPKAVAGRNGFR